ncbi:TonB-dependent receptor [Alteromonas lipolytica]|uniref:TonB-dependent receptor n=1 Tax=Alteromonas lipolytica TaxID=1856405 RepID=A0A1E8FL36_9ALTE|nr:TonB-dependent receptor [Alteromonas lipolytica]OFI36338.1 TonB-dependent receptor [Alteromonas lipolytica]GGF70694.1 TonB-dependent receptor [Alteromonas lipolytica]
MQELHFKKSVLTSIIISLLYAVPNVHAVANDQPLAEEEAAEDIETIMITIDQRQVSLQDAPVAVTAVSSELMEQANITDATGLNGYVPGLQINKSGGSERMVSIRGVGSQTPENFFSNPGVSFHMDGAYITNNIALNMGFLDVEHVEVLRGPQGTAFGAASTGGTLNVISKRPVLEEFSGNVTASVGNYDYLQGKVSVNLPVGSTLAFRGVFQTTSHDGYATSNGIEGGYDLDDADNDNMRLSALWQPTDDVSILFIAQHYEDYHNAAALKAIDDPNPDPRVVTQDFPGKFNMKMDIDNVIVTWDLDWATLKSTTSYQNMEHDQSFDSDRSVVALFGGYDHVATWATSAETVMQEISLSSTPGGKFDWVIGGFYLNSDSNQYINEYAGTDASDPTPVLPKNTPAEAVPGNISYAENSLLERTSWAPFFQGTYHISDDLNVIAGIRYNDDKFESLSSTYFAPMSPGSFDTQEVTGKLGVQYDISEDHMAYFTWSKGYKAGGINGGAANAMVVSTEIQPEKVMAYELGSKSQLLDKKLQLNVSAFYYQYDDMQYIQEDPIPYSGGLGNIPEANIWGAEFEALWTTMDDNLVLGLNATLLDGEYPVEYYALDRREADAAGAAALADGTAPYPWSYEWFLARGSATVDVGSNTPPNLADLSAGLHATYFYELSSGLITARAEYIYKGDYQARIFNTDVDLVDSYDQVNLFVKYEPFEGNWSAWVTVTNLTDDANTIGRFVDPYGSGVVSDEFLAPRQVIANFSYSF